MKYLPSFKYFLKNEQFYNFSLCTSFKNKIVSKVILLMQIIFVIIFCNIENKLRTFFII